MIFDRDRRRRIAKVLARYWGGSEQLLDRLPLARVDELASTSPLRIVSLPAWASPCNVDGGLLVPETALTGNGGWRDVDWLAAAWWFLEGIGERDFERRHGPIHSYAWRLRGWDERLWSRAWVNRIAWFLRLWLMRELDASTDVGDFPPPRIIVTHDVDAVRKTAAIRLKQGSFHLFNAVRASVRGRLGLTVKRFVHAIGFMMQPGSYDRFAEIRELEGSLDLRSTFLFYVPETGHGCPLARVLFDPHYDPADEPVLARLRELLAGGWRIGLHPSFCAWRDPGRLRRGRERLEGLLGVEISAVRQHWLRFSWNETWRAQARAGFRWDGTLGFNDRPGFRTAAALAWNPEGVPGGLLAVPIVLMDSHLYDYAEYDDDEARWSTVARWLDEVVAVGGTASVIWHQRVFAADYGWGELYRRLLRTYREWIVAAPE